MKGQPHIAPWQYSLGSLLLVTTIIGGHLGLVVAFPLLGVPLAVFALPALVRTSVDLSRREHRCPALAEKLEAYIISLSATVAAVFASLEALLLCGLFGAVVLGRLYPMTASLAQAPIFGEVLVAVARAALFVVAAGPGILATGATFAAIYWKTLPPKKRRR